MSRLFVTLLLVARAACAADENVARYEIHSKGLTVGHVETIRSRVSRNGDELERIQVNTKVDLNLLVVNQHISAQEDVLFGNDGVVEFSHKATENGKPVETRGSLNAGVFHFARSEGGVTNTYDIARTNYVFTTLDGLELKLPKGSNVLHRVLDCTRCQVIERSYRWVDDGKVVVRGHDIVCRVVEYADALKRGRRWVASDDHGLLLLRQEADEPRGSYSMWITDQFDRPMKTTEVTLSSHASSAKILEQDFRFASALVVFQPSFRRKYLGRSFFESALLLEVIECLRGQSEEAINPKFPRAIFGE